MVIVGAVGGRTSLVGVSKTVAIVVVGAVSGAILLYLRQATRNIISIVVNVGFAACGFGFLMRANWSYEYPTGYKLALLALAR